MPLNPPKSLLLTPQNHLYPRFYLFFSSLLIIFLSLPSNKWFITSNLSSPEPYNSNIFLRLTPKVTQGFQSICYKPPKSHIFFFLNFREALSFNFPSTKPVTPHTFGNLTTTTLQSFQFLLYLTPKVPYFLLCTYTQSSPEFSFTKPPMPHIFLYLIPKAVQSSQFLLYKA